MQTIESRIKERLMHKNNPQFDTSDLNDYIADITTIGYDRFIQFLSRIHLIEPKRIISVQEIVEISKIEHEIRSFLTSKISVFELLFRSVLSEYYLLWYGVHGYKKEALFEDKETHDYLLYKIRKQLKMQPEYEVAEVNIVDDIYELPIWSAMEISTFQMLTIFYKILPDEYKDQISKYFLVEDREIFFSWIEFILVVRNACAHQGLLFSREFKRRTILPSPYKRTSYSANYVLSFLLKDDFEMKHETIEKFFDEGFDWVKPYYGILT